MFSWKMKKKKKILRCKKMGLSDKMCLQDFQVTKTDFQHEA